MQDTNLEDILSQLESSSSNSTSFGENWSQGRSAFGGLAAAFAVTAMRKQLPLARTIRSLMVSFIAPVPAGTVKLDATVLRQGKNVTQCSASLLADGQVALQAMAAFGNSREAYRPPTHSKIELPNRSQGIRFDEHTERLPRFLHYFDGCWIDGGMPFSGNYQPCLKMWVRHKQDLTNFPVEKIITIADIPPPVLLSHFEKPPVPASSLSWSLEFVEAPESIAGEWFYLEFNVDAAADGYTQQSGRVFDETGRLVALTRQCMVYFG